MPASPATHVPALPAMGPGILLRALLKRPQHPLPARLPELVTEYRLDSLPLDDIARYRAAFGFAGDGIPLTWWYLPAQRAHLATMLDPRFPFRIAGLVHMDNVIEEHGSVAPGQALLLRTVLRILPPSASGALRCVLETTGIAAGAPVFSCSSTYLIRRGEHGAASLPEAGPDLSGRSLAQWTLDPAAGRRYARLSGDWNPIHLTRWSARLMGMRKPIIHGMHTLASCCSVLENESGRSAVRIECRFRSPVALGSAVVLRATAGTGGFVVEADGKQAVTGHCLLA
ncbi:MaoC/PaaZ C-terminal domain-containing protein [Massilia alkalitolerans]|jgi:acyl dehydratase|uniref:MaoC/PaaZ C-terminal domain-containing protein n=1 Tax=Massilia alkalitolerans TaxID=286638 RepID=UPI000400E083|nr:MaoC/PaaZ C-terminal domain-containing protein [Massilia alkalitolerans]